MKKIVMLLVFILIVSGCAVKTQEPIAEVVEVENTEIVEETIEPDVKEEVEEVVEEVVEEPEPIVYETYIPDPDGLRVIAEDMGMKIGTAFDLKYYKRELYMDAVTNEFNTITMENMMKWASMNPNQDKYLFSGVDVARELARKYQLNFRGHTLVWHQQLPLWLTKKSGQWTKQELLDIIEGYVENVVGHFKGDIYTWDVLNEIIEEDGSFRESMWYKYTGEDYISLALETARKADPDAILVINDYSVETLNPKSDGLYNLCKQLLDDGVPLDGVGFQCHFINDQIDFESFEANIQRFRALGLDVQLTEIDLRMDSPITEEKLASQGENYKKIMEIALRNDIDTFVVWGVNDSLSWVSGFFVGYSTPLLFDRNYEPKPAYEGVKEALLNFE